MSFANYPPPSVPLTGSELFMIAQQQSNQLLTCTATIEDVSTSTQNTLGISRPLQAIQTISVSASPFTYTAAICGTVYISGTTTSVQLTRGITTITCGSLSGPFPVSPGDSVIVGYSAAPSMYFVPT